MLHKPVQQAPHKKRYAEMSKAQHFSMTQPAYTRLNKELAALRGRQAMEVPDDYMDTDEDFDDYRARRYRIGVIEKLLAEAFVDDNSTRDVAASPGAVVTVHYDDTGGTETFVLGGYGAGDDDNKIYPLRSPIGRAVAGARPGQHRTYTLPEGPRIAVTLLDVEPSAQSTMTKGRSATVAGSCRRRPQVPVTTASGLRQLLSAPLPASEHVETQAVPRVLAACIPRSPTQSAPARAARSVDKSPAHNRPTPTKGTGDTRHGHD